MKNHKDIGELIAILFMIVVLVSSAGWVPIASASSHQPVPEDQTFEIDGIDVWDRAALPLRTDTRNAQTTVDNAFWSIEQSGLGPVPIKKVSPVGVYQVDDQVTIQFDRTDAFSTQPGLSNRDVQLVIAHIEESDPDDVPRSFSEVFDLLTEDDANDLASFEVLSGQTDNAGKASFTHTVEKPGQYVFFLATKEDEKDGFEADDGDLAIDGRVTVIGVTNAMAQEDVSGVDAPSQVSAGDTAMFDVDANSGGVDGTENVKHAVVLYRESDFTSSRMLLQITGELSADYDIGEDSNLKHSIAEVNGVARVDQPISALDIDVSDGRISRTVGVGFIFDFIAEKAGTYASDDSAIEPKSTLDGSVTVVRGASAFGEVEVETVEDWQPGDYRWIHVAVGGESSEVTTNTGTLRVIKPSGPSAGNQDGQGTNDANADNNDNDDSDDGSPAVGPRIADAEPSLTESTNLVDDNEEKAGVNLLFQQGIVDEITLPDGTPLSGNLMVHALDSTPAPSEMSEDGSISDVVRALRITAPSEVRENGGTIRFSVSQEALGERDPETARLALLTDSGWKLLDTTPVDTADGTVVFTANTPHFSDFAVVLMDDGGATESSAQTTQPTSSASSQTESGQTDSSSDSETSSDSTNQSTASSSGATAAASSGGQGSSGGASTADQDSDDSNTGESSSLGLTVLGGGIVGLLIILIGYDRYRQG